MTSAAAGAARNWAMLVVLLALCALFYAITIVKMTQVMTDCSACRSAHRSRWRSLAGAVVVGMVGLSFASVPLYRAVLRRHRLWRHAADRRGGRARRGTRQLITVRFNANTNPDLPWDFRPVQDEIRLPLGEEHLAFYTARNEAGTPVTGVALYNVTPDKAGKYFHKTACFCFNQQTLAAGQQMQFPLSFLVDPAIAKDPEHSGRPHDHAVLHLLPHARRRGEVRRARTGRSACRSAEARRPLERADEFAMMRQPLRENGFGMSDDAHGTTTVENSGLKHPYHLVDPSPWPIIGALGGLLHRARHHLRRALRQLHHAGRSAR